MVTNRATNANSVEIAVLRTQMNEVIDQLKQIDAKLDAFADHYIKRSEFDLFKKNQWLERILIVIVTSSLTYLVADFLKGQ